MAPAEAIAAGVAIVVCAPSVPALMVAVAVYRWPSWWLVVAGMFTAWTADAVRALARHAFAAFAVRRSHRRRESGGLTQHATPTERDTRAGDPR